jgi:hypothetical protein
VLPEQPVQPSLQALEHGRASVMGVLDKCILKGERMLRAGRGAVKRNALYATRPFVGIIGYSLITTG